MPTWVVKRFPAWRQQIEQLNRKDAEFREICQDYELAAQTLARWSQSTLKTEARIQEYQQLLQELEAEIQEALLTGANIAAKDE